VDRNERWNLAIEFSGASGILDLTHFQRDTDDRSAAPLNLLRLAKKVTLVRREWIAAVSQISRSTLDFFVAFGPKDA